jgi:hypothetical protein
MCSPVCSVWRITDVRYTGAVYAMPWDAMESRYMRHRIPTRSSGHPPTRGPGLGLSGVITLGGDVAPLPAGRRPAGRPRRGRVCHSALIFIGTCSLTAMIACSFERAQWRWALNERLARGCRPPTPPSRSRACAFTRSPSASPPARVATGGGAIECPPPPARAQGVYGHSCD